MIGNRWWAITHVLEGIRALRNSIIIRQDLKRNFELFQKYRLRFSINSTTGSEAKRAIATEACVNETDARRGREALLLGFLQRLQSRIEMS